MQQLLLQEYARLVVMSIAVHPGAVAQAEFRG
jgi:hypothetical protein